MKKLRFLFLGALVASGLFVVPSSAQAACVSTLGDTCMAAYTLNTNPGEALYYFDGGSNHFNGWCQPFTVDAGATNFYVTHIAFNVKKNGTPTGYGAIMWRIYDNAGGANCNTQLGSLLGGNDNVTDTSSGTASLVDGPATTNVQLVQSHTYFLVSSTTNQGTDSTNYYQGTISNTVPPYSDEFYKTNSTFNQETGYNLTFEIDGKSTAPFATAVPIAQEILAFQ